jgi:hypothetical protein
MKPVSSTRILTESQKVYNKRVEMINRIRQWYLNRKYKRTFHSKVMQGLADYREGRVIPWRESVGWKYRESKELPDVESWVADKETL